MHWRTLVYIPYLPELLLSGFDHQLRHRRCKYDTGNPRLFVCSGPYTDDERLQLQEVANPIKGRSALGDLTNSSDESTSRQPVTKLRVRTRMLRMQTPLITSPRHSSYLADWLLNRHGSSCFGAGSATCVRKSAV